jgi:hypothetical protein
MGEGEGGGDDETEGGEMEKINRGLMRFFTEHYKPGIIGIVGTKHAIGMAIREAQKAVTVDGEASLWSHCFIFGDLRLDRRGKGGQEEPEPIYI